MRLIAPAHRTIIICVIFSVVGSLLLSSCQHYTDSSLSEDTPEIDRSISQSGSGQPDGQQQQPNPDSVHTFLPVVPSPTHEANFRVDFVLDDIYQSTPANVVLDTPDGENPRRSAQVASSLPTATPTVHPILGVSCPTPKSLMLHSAFGRQRMAELADEIIQHNWRTITYRDLLQDVRSGICPGKDTIIISIDDLGTSWLRPTFVEMIAEFTNRGLVLVVGVVVGEPQSDAIWQYLRELNAAGIEVASHTVNHINLESANAEARNSELAASFRLICERLGECPTSLILPFGSGGEIVRQAAKSIGYQFIVSIPQGKQIDSDFPCVVGRIPPDNESQLVTITMLENSFP